MDTAARNKAKTEYKQAAQPAGVFRITNTANGKIFVGSSVNVPGTLNRFRFELQMGSCKIEQLQEDWKTFGADKFTFETLELIDSEEGVKDIADEVTALEELYLEKLKSFGDNGYNKVKQV